MTSLAPKWFPEKIRDWLTWPQADGGGKSSEAETIPPYLPKETPGSGGPRPGGGRRPVSEKPKPGTAEAVGASLDALQAAQAALRAERTAQAKRVAALSECQSTRDRQHEKLDADTLAKALDQLKKDFEKLQEELRHQVGDRLNEIDKLVHDYDGLWADAMKALDEYFAGLNKIGGPLRDLWNARADMDWALALAEAGDEGLQILQMLMPVLLEMRALKAAEQATLAAQLAKAEKASLARMELQAAESAEKQLALNAEKEAARLEMEATKKAEQQLALNAEKEAARLEAQAAKNAEKKLAEGVEKEAAAAEAKREAEAAARKALQQELDKAKLSRNPYLREGVMQDEVQKALQSGAAKDKRLLFFGDDPNGLKAVDGMVNKGFKGDGWVVGVHGLETGDKFAIYTRVGDTMQYVEVTPNQLAQMMRDAGYKGGPVRLVSCWSGTGAQPGAQELAKALRAEVTAPRGAFTAMSNGGMKVTVADGGKHFVTYGADGSIVR